MPRGVTKEQFDERMNGVEGRLDGMASRFERIDARFDGIEAAIRGGIQDVIAHFNQSQGLQNQRLGRIEERMDQGFQRVAGRFDDLDAKLGLVVEDISAERHLHNLVGVLRKEGLSIDDQDVFLH